MQPVGAHGQVRRPDHGAIMGLAISDNPCSATIFQRSGNLAVWLNSVREGCPSRTTTA